MNAPDFVAVQTAVQTPEPGSTALLLAGGHGAGNLAIAPRGHIQHIVTIASIYELHLLCSNPYAIHPNWDPNISSEVASASSSCRPTPSPNRKIRMIETALILDQLAALGQLYSLPGVAMQVLQLTRNPHVDTRALKECIENDPAISSRILRVVNSSIFGLSREVTDLNRPWPCWASSR